MALSWLQRQAQAATTANKDYGFQQAGLNSKDWQNALATYNTQGLSAVPAKFKDALSMMTQGGKQANLTTQQAQAWQSANYTNGGPGNFNLANSINNVGTRWTNMANPLIDFAKGNNNLANALDQSTTQAFNINGNQDVAKTLRNTAAIVGGGYLAAPYLGAGSGAATAAQAPAPIVELGTGAATTAADAAYANAIAAGASVAEANTAYLAAGGTAAALTGGASAALAGGSTAATLAPTVAAGMSGAQMAQLGLGAAGIGATLYGANQAKQTADAANASQQAAAATATAENARQFNIGQTNQAPWLKAGQQALTSQQDLMGLGPNGSQQAMTNLQSSPGYQFRLNQGQKSLDAGLAARGGMGSGKAMQGGIDYNQNFASNEYGNRLNQLANLSTAGQNTAVGMATQGQNYATNQGNIAMNAANANAASNIAQQNATNSSIIGGLNLASGIAANWNNPNAAWNNNQSTLPVKV